VNERIYVDGPCYITVSSINGSNVKLGFEAERSTKVIREEVLERESESDE